MAELRDVVGYLLENYPHKGELSNARVTKMVYLSDWKHVLEEGSQISNINWYFDNYGPFVWDVFDTIKANPKLFDFEQTANFYGGSKTLLKCVDPSFEPRLSATEKKAIDHVIKSTSPMNFDSFIGLVYSTYPIVSSERYEHLDLVAAAKQYKKTAVYQEVNEASAR